MEFILHWIIVLITFFFFVLSGNSTVLTEKDVIKICSHYKNKKEFKYFNNSCNLIAAISKIESSYYVESYNEERTGSYGLMQIQCSTAKMMGLKYSCEQLFIPQINIRFGMKYLMWLKTNKNIIKTLDLIAAWNAGAIYICKKINRNKKGNIKCYPNEYINYEYVTKVYRHYRYLNQDYKKYLKHNQYFCYEKCNFNTECIALECY